LEKRDIRHLTIPVEDTVNQDLLQHFRETNEFIHSALAHEGRVLVHWLVSQIVVNAQH
jgi:protein-tyrosine phosphatase